MRVRSGCALAALAATFAVGCGSDSVHVHGRLLKADGTPAAGVPVSASRLSAYTATDGEGRYELSGSPDSADVDKYLGITAGTAPDHPYGALQLEVAWSSDDLEVPDVRLWDDALVASSPSDGGMHLDWRSAPAGLSFASAMVLQPATYGEGTVSWIGPVAGTSADLTPELFEDHLGAVLVAASDYEYGSECTKPLCVRAFTRTVVLDEAGARVPRSRGAICTLVSQGGAATRVLDKDTGSCPLTDGNNYPSWYTWLCGDEQCQPARELIIDLGAETPIQAVVVRNLSTLDLGPWEVAVASDGTGFETIDRHERSSYFDFAEAVLATPRTARFVRVSAPGSSIIYLGEVSVF